MCSLPPSSTWFTQSLPPFTIYHHRNWHHSRNAFRTELTHISTSFSSLLSSSSSSSLLHINKIKPQRLIYSCPFILMDLNHNLNPNSETTSLCMNLKMSNEQTLAQQPWYVWNKLFTSSLTAYDKYLYKFALVFVSRCW